MGGQTREEILEKYRSGGSRSASSQEDIANKYASGGSNIQPLDGSMPYEPTAQDRINAFGGGASMGFADEIRAGMGAGLDYITGQGDDFGANYESLLNTYQDEEARYAKAAPKENLALGLAGGLATGGVTAAKAIPATMTGIPKALAHLGVAAGEGAVTGAASARQGERLKGAEEGALLGAGLRTLTGTIGEGARQFSQRRAAQELGSGKDFIPFHMAAPENKLANAYESTFGRMLLSQLPDQVERVQQRVRPQLNRALKAGEDASAAAKTKAKALKQKLTQNRANVFLKADEAAQDTASLSTKEARATATAQRNALNAGGEFGEQKALDNFRLEAKNASIPPNASKEVIEKIQKADTQGAVRSLEQVWKGAFKDVKSKTFDVNPQEVIDDALGDIKVPGLDDYSKGILDQLQAKLAGKTKLPKATKLNPLIHGSTKAAAPSQVGKIAGADLMEARNSFRVAINEMKDKGASAQQREAFRRIAKRLDTVIEDGLSKSEKAAYRAERDAWGNYQTIRGASGRAAATKQGDFTPADWITEKKLAQKRRVDAGTAPLQQEAQATQRAIEANKTRVAGMVDDAQDTATTAIDKAQDTRRTTQRGLKRAKKEATDKANLRNKPQLEPEDMGVSYGAAKEAEKTLAGASPDTSNVFTQRAVQSLLPAIAAGSSMGPAGAAAGSVAGILAGKPLTSEGFQRMLAGQTGMQKQLAEHLRKTPEEWSMIEQAIRRGTIANQ